VEVGVGLDLIEIGRIERALERYPRLAARIFTDQEIAYATSRRRPGRHLAARFAAKEAVVKAASLGPGTSLRQIEILPGPPPRVKLHGEAASVAGEEVRFSISLTHEREMAAAVVVAGRA
jgi:holo-[acyl-carrier protein] synthase